MIGDELEAIDKRTDGYIHCRLVLGVSPALADLGIPNLAQGSELESSCSRLADQGLIPSIDAPM